MSIYCKPTPMLVLIPTWRGGQQSLWSFWLGANSAMKMRRDLRCPQAFVWVSTCCGVRIITYSVGYTSWCGRVDVSRYSHRRQSDFDNNCRSVCVERTRQQRQLLRRHTPQQRWPYDSLLYRRCWSEAYHSDKNASLHPSSVRRRIVNKRSSVRLPQAAGCCLVKKTL